MLYFYIYTVHLMYVKYVDLRIYFPFRQVDAIQNKNNFTFQNYTDDYVQKTSINSVYFSRQLQ